MVRLLEKSSQGPTRGWNRPGLRPGVKAPRVFDGACCILNLWVHSRPGGSTADRWAARYWYSTFIFLGKRRLLMCAYRIWGIIAGISGYFIIFFIIGLFNLNISTEDARTIGIITGLAVYFIPLFIWPIIKTSHPKNVQLSSEDIQKLLLLSRGNSPITAATAHDENSKKCPFCAEDIRKEAIVCRYCGRDLPLKIESEVININRQEIEQERDDKIIESEEKKINITKLPVDDESSWVCSKCGKINREDRDNCWFCAKNKLN
jgi:hypothetical protein